MDRKEKVALLFWWFSAIFICIESWRLGLGNLNLPGPGFLPFFASLAIALFVIVLFLKERNKEAVKQTPSLPGKRVRNIYLILAALFAFSFLLSRIGFFLCTVLFIAFCVKWIGEKSWRSAIGISLTTAIVSNLVFINWLKIRIPELHRLERIFSLGDFLWK